MDFLHNVQPSLLLVGAMSLSCSDRLHGEIVDHFCNLSKIKGKNKNKKDEKKIFKPRAQPRLEVKGTSKSQEFTPAIPLPGCPPSPIPFCKFKSSPCSKAQLETISHKKPPYPLMTNSFSLSVQSQQ